MSAAGFVKPSDSPWRPPEDADPKTNAPAPPPELADQIDQTLAYVRERATAVSAHAERIGDTVQMRLAIARGDQTINGHLVLSFYARYIHAFFQAELPDGPGSLNLQSQTGVLGWMLALGERKVGDRDLDAAYVVHGDDAGLELTHLAPVSLVRASRFSTSVGVRSVLLRVVCAHVPPYEEMVGRVLDVVQDLWPAVVERRLAATTE
jgi:hypothetical protein